MRGLRKWSHAILGASVKRSDIGQGKSEEWGEGVEIDTHVLHMVESFFFSAALCRNRRDQPFHWNNSLHGCITGWRREGAMITQRAVSVRLKKEGISNT